MSNLNDILTRKPKPNTFSDEGEFIFPNGDTYVGQYQAKKKGRTVTRQGRGCYTTWDGQVYTGFWQNDQLDFPDESKIVFGDGSHYTGSVEEMCFSKHGSYTFPNGSILTAFFENNSVTREVNMNDGGKEWTGSVYDEILRLIPVSQNYKNCPGKKDNERTITKDQKII